MTPEMGGYLEPHPYAMKPVEMVKIRKNSTHENHGWIQDQKYV